MNEYRHHIQTRGHYQIVALTRDADYEEDDIYAYAVLSSSGLKLRQELTLSDARLWLEQWERELASSGAPGPDIMAASRPPAPPSARPGRRRR